MLWARELTLFTCLHVVLGQNSGKEVFHAKTVRPDGQPFTPEDIQHHEHRHAELEKDFIRATLHSIIKSGKVRFERCATFLVCHHLYITPSSPLIMYTKSFIQNSQQRRKSDPFPPSRSIVPTRRNIKEPVHGGFIPSCAKAQRSTSLQLTTSSIVTQQLEPAPGYYRQPIPLFASHNDPMLTGNAIQVQQDYNFMPTIPGSMTQDQVVAYAPAAYNAPPLLHSNHAISAINCFDIMHNNDARVAMKEEGESKKRSVSELMSSVGYGFSPLIDEKRYKPTASHTVSTASDTSDPSSNDESEPFSHQGGNSATKPDSHNSDFPDLLSGFDKIQKKKVEKTTAPIPEDSHFFLGASIAESPYITSKSFDDLHKSLGAGLSGDKMSHLDLNNHSSGGGIPACVGGGDNVHTFEQVPFSHHQHQPSLNACRAYYRPPSTSNSSDLTASD